MQSYIDALYICLRLAFNFHFLFIKRVSRQESVIKTVFESYHPLKTANETKQYTDSVSKYAKKNISHY